MGEGGGHDATLSSIRPQVALIQLSVAGKCLYQS